jgi:hypothetical protein
MIFEQHLTTCCVSLQPILDNLGLYGSLLIGDIFCANPITLQRVAAGNGGAVQISVNNVIDEVSCKHAIFYLLLIC